MKKAVLYARVSSDIQKKEKTIDSQVAELKKQIAKSGDTLVDVYVDDGYSGAMLDRPAMNKLRDDLKTKLFDTIYILNTDRIARDVTYQNIIIGEMLRYKKQIIINGKDYINNPENKFTLTVLGAVSELERSKIIERTNRGKQHRLSQGLLLGMGWQTYGYIYHKKTDTSFPSYDINGVEAKIIRYIFESYADGQISIRSISTELAEMGAERRRGRNTLGASQIGAILRNEMYTGTRYFNTMSVIKTGDPLGKQTKRVELRDRSAWIGIKVPAIISKALFDRVQKRLAENMVSYRNGRRKYVLSQMVWCGVCGTRCYAYRRYYSTQQGNTKHVHQRASYKCGAKGVADNREVDTRVLERCVFDMIEKTITDPAALRTRIDFFKRSGRVSQAKIERKIAHMDEQAKKAADAKSRIVDLYASGGIPLEDYTARIAKYDLEATGLAEEQAKLTKNNPLFHNIETLEKSVFEYAEQAKKEYGAIKDFQSKRQFVLKHATKVVYNQRKLKNIKVQIYGSVPVSEQGSLNFMIERKIGRKEINAYLDNTTGNAEIYWNQKAPVNRYGELKAIKKLPV